MEKLIRCYRYAIVPSSVQRFGDRESRLDSAKTLERLPRSAMPNTRSREKSETSWVSLILEVNKIKASLAQLLARLRAEHPDACEAILTKRYVLPNVCRLCMPVGKPYEQDTYLIPYGLDTEREMSRPVALNIEASLPYGRATLYLNGNSKKLMCRICQWT